MSEFERASWWPRPTQHLPRTVKPYVGEPPLGLIGRLATANSIAVIPLMHHIAVVPPSGHRWRDCDINLLATINLATCIGVADEHLRGLLRGRVIGGSPRVPRLVERRLITPWLTWEQRSCPSCLADRNTAHLTSWLEPQAFVCETHDSALVGSRVRDPGGQFGLSHAQGRLNQLVNRLNLERVATAFEAGAASTLTRALRGSLREVVDGRLEFGGEAGRTAYLAVDVAIAALPEIVHQTTMLAARR